MENNLQKIIKYFKVLLLPFSLALLFSFQNYAFNNWLKIANSSYTFRLITVTFALGVILYWPSLLFKKHKYIYLLVISFLISLIFSAQFLYYRYSQSFLQCSAIKYMCQAESLTGTVKTMITPELLLFTANFLLVLAVFLLILKKKSIEFILPVAGKAVVVLLIIFTAFFGYKYLLDTEKKEWGSTSRLYSDVYDLKSLVGKMGIMNFFIEDTFKYVLRSNLVSAADTSFLNNFAKNRKISETTNPKYFGAEKGKNVIIIQVESLENAVINQTIGGDEITPNLNKLAKEGLYFDNYYTQVGPGNTADAEFSTLNSLYPLPDDVAFIDYAKNQYYALPQLLRNNNYDTYSLHGDVPTFWNRSNIYPELGYEKAFDLDDYVVTRPVGKGPSDLGDEDLFSQSLPKLENMKQPFMATVITMSSHTPFILPDDLQTLQIPDQTNLTPTQWEYLQSVHYTDKAIGEFIDGLKKDGLFDNSLIFIWGDHGSFTNISSALGQDKNTLQELSNSQVPMILFAPKTDLQGTDNIPASHLDIYPTITNLLGIKTPKTIFGQDILNTKTPVETHFELVSGGIDAILTPNLAYTADDGGQFQNGYCKSWPDKKPLAVSACQNLYNQQQENVKASDIIIRGNLLNVLKTK